MREEGWEAREWREGREGWSDGGRERGREGEREGGREGGIGLSEVANQTANIT